MSERARRDRESDKGWDDPVGADQVALKGGILLWRVLFGLIAAFLLVGCGTAGSDAESGKAELWVTRDGGSEVMLTAEVSSGLTVLQALESETDVETRFGGRFVQTVDGVEGSVTAQEDWFYFLNGIEPDVGAAEVVLEDGDVVWWDHRFWGEQMRQPVVVGAFPEPFLRGFSREPRRVEIVAPPDLADEAAALGELLTSETAAGEPHRFVLEIDESVEGAELRAARGDASDSPVTFTLVGEADAVRAGAVRLVDEPSAVRFCYSAWFDTDGEVECAKP